jgi:thioredoxin reductase (NADPH)
VEVVDNFAGAARTIGILEAGSFVGELNMLTDQALYLSAVVREGGEVLAIPREHPKKIVTEEFNVSDVRRDTGRPYIMANTAAGSRVVLTFDQNEDPEVHLRDTDVIDRTLGL